MKIWEPIAFSIYKGKEGIQYGFERVPGLYFWNGGGL
jgi:hypothetical protein